MNTTPSAGAVRAAEKISDVYLPGKWHRKDDPRLPIIATIIDKETGLADLVEALRAALPILEYRHRHGDDSNDDAPAYELVRAALAKHQGK